MHYSENPDELAQWAEDTKIELAKTIRTGVKHMPYTIRGTLIDHEIGGWSFIRDFFLTAPKRPNNLLGRGLTAISDAAGG